LSASRSEQVEAKLALLNGTPNEQVILQGLLDDSTTVRERAIALAARYLAPETLSIHLGNGDDAILRNAAIAALTRQGPYSVPHLVDLVSSGECDEVVMFATEVLGEIGDARATAAIIPLLRHRDLNVSQAAAVALGNIRALAAVPDLIRLLGEDLWLQVAAISALGSIGDPDSVDPLVGCLGDDMVDDVVIEALGRIGTPNALSPLVHLLNESHELLRHRVVLSIGWILDRHPDPGTDFAEIQRAIKSSGRDSLETYLREVLEGVERHLWHAAGLLAVAAGFQRLYPLVLRKLYEGGHDARTLRVFCRVDHAFRVVCEQHLEERDPVARRAALSALSHDLSVQRLITFLEDDDSVVRAAICGALGEKRDVAAVPMLLDKMLHGAEAEHAAAKHALALMPGEGLGGLEIALGSEAPEVTIDILRILEASRSRLFASWSREKLRSSRADIRICALRALVNVPGDEVRTAMRECLTDPDDGVRAETIDCLVRREASGIAKELVERLEVADGVRYNVIRGLGRLGFGGAVEPLLALFPHASSLEKTAIIEALVLIEDADLGDFLWQIVRTTDTDMRKVAARGLAHTAGPADLASLIELAVDADWYIRNHVALAMRRLGLEQSRETLLTLARDVEPIVAQAARIAIEKLDDTART
jgi:HEAT repeat protein